MRRPSPGAPTGSKRSSSGRLRHSGLRRAALLLLLVACGSRTGLFVDDEGGPDFPDRDLTVDGGRDGGRDVDTDQEDALPPIDARPPKDVDRTDCADADATLVYTITSTNELQSFDPASGQFKMIGRIACPANPGETPFSMAVDRRGIAYILFTDYHLYRVSTATGACISTSYVPRQDGFNKFGMGFATNSVGPTETLFVAGSTQDNGATGLARIDPSTFKLTTVGDLLPVVDDAELTGTGDGRLYAFYRKNGDTPPSYIGEIDTETGHVVGERRFDGIEQGYGWAFAFWAGDFYMFHAPGPIRGAAGSRVTRWRPADDSVVQVATTNLKIVGAGVSTCAPQQ